MWVFAEEEEEEEEEEEGKKRVESEVWCGGIRTRRGTGTNTSSLYVGVFDAPCCQALGRIRDAGGPTSFLRKAYSHRML